MLRFCAYISLLIIIMSVGNEIYTGRLYYLTTVQFLLMASTMLVSLILPMVFCSRWWLTNFVKRLPTSDTYTWYIPEKIELEDKLRLRIYHSELNTIGALTGIIMFALSLVTLYFLIEVVNHEPFAIYFSVGVAALAGIMQFFIYHCFGGMLVKKRYYFSCALPETLISDFQFGVYVPPLFLALAYIRFLY